LADVNYFFRRKAVIRCLR